MASVPWIKVSTSFFTHRKTIKLRATIGDSEPILRLWAWAAQCADSGDLTGISVAEIEDAIGWKGKQGKAFDAFVLCGFIDVDGEKITIHGWDEHTGGGVKKLLHRRTKQRELMRSIRNGSNSGEDVSANKLSNNEPNERETSSLLSSSLRDHVPDPDLPARDPSATGTEHELPADHKRGDKWLVAFKGQWEPKHGRQYGRSTMADARAVSELSDLLASLPDEETKELYERRKDMVSEFLSTADVRTVKAGLPFSWFVGQFRGLMIPKHMRPRPTQQNTGQVPALPLLGRLDD